MTRRALARLTRAHFKSSKMAWPKPHKSKSLYLFQNWLTLLKVVFGFASISPHPLCSNMESIPDFKNPPLIFKYKSELKRASAQTDGHFSNIESIPYLSRAGLGPWRPWFKYEIAPGYGTISSLQGLQVFNASEPSKPQGLEALAAFKALTPQSCKASGPQGLTASRL